MITDNSTKSVHFGGNNDFQLLIIYFFNKYLWNRNFSLKEIYSVKNQELIVRMNYSETKKENRYYVENRKTHKCERKHLFSYKYLT